MTLMRPIAMMAAIRIGLCACLLSMSFDALQCQTPKTSTPAPEPTGAPLSAASSVMPAPPRRLVVHRFGNQLEIDANNAPLKDVLDEISAKAAITITGKVPGDTVFGHYGPSSVRDILVQMIGGTGVNMLFVERPPHTYDEEDQTGGELILSERHGGPDPPNPHPADPSRTANSARPPSAVSANPASNAVVRPQNQQPMVDEEQSPRPAQSPANVPSANPGGSQRH